MIHMEHIPRVAEAIQKQMKEKDLSDRSLAKAAGIPATTLGRKLSQGGESFTVLELKRIALALNVGVIYLLEGST